jgi:peptide/nickel transport system substrate-binding protein
MMKEKLFRLAGVLIAISMLASMLIPSSPVQATWNAPASENTMVYATFGDPNTLDPALAYDTASGYIIGQVYETLITYNREKTDQFIPMLADSWTISADAKTYTFHIRPGVKFHDGHLLTAEDVAYSFWRGLLQSGPDSPQWLLTEPILGLNITDIAFLVDPSGILIGDREGMKAANPVKLAAACTTVKSGITYDNSTGNVVFHLVQPWSPFLVTLAGSWGSVMDKDWVSSHGGWNGNCDTWQNYYAMQVSEDPFTTIVNGTGAFMLDHWTPNTEVVLTRHPNYWRTSPMWPGGPSGLTALQQVTIKNEPDNVNRVNMLINGNADIAYVNSTDYAALDPYVLLRYDAAGQSSKFSSPTGVLQVHENIPSVSADDAFFNFNISPDSTYVGTGTWGSGIPLDFFNDIHVRKAFNYAFNWDEYINQAFGGRAIQRTGPIIKGVMGYSDTQPHYSYDPVQANNEFAQAFEGAVTDNGFTLTIPYNAGNLIRQKFCEILKTGIEALNPKFHVNIISIPWSDILPAYQHGRLPLYIVGWLQDLPHPHPWVDVYTIGTYGRNQNLPEPLAQAYATKVSTCLTKVGDEARVCYEDIQTSTYVDARNIFLAQKTNSDYLRAEVRGYYHNPALYGPYLYALSKGPLPTITTVTSGSSATVSFNDGQGSTGSISMPAGSVASDTRVAVTPALNTSGAPAGFRLGNLAFDIQAYMVSDGSPTSLTFTTPVQITLHYTNTSRGLLVEDSLRLFYWDGSNWQDAACGEYVRDPLNDTIAIPVCHFSKFALGGTTLSLYLPMLMK